MGALLLERTPDMTDTNETLLTRYDLFIQTVLCQNTHSGLEFQKPMAQSDRAKITVFAKDEKQAIQLATPYLSVPEQDRPAHIQAAGRMPVTSR